MYSKIFAAFAVCGALAACSHGTPDMTEELTKGMAGHTFVTDNASIDVNKDGTLSGTMNGEPVTGAWEERDGRLCQTITTPESAAGTKCHTVTFDGQQASLFNADGTLDSVVTLK